MKINPTAGPWSVAAARSNAFSSQLRHNSDSSSRRGRAPPRAPLNRRGHCSSPAPPSTREHSGLCHSRQESCLPMYGQVELPGDSTCAPALTAAPQRRHIRAPPIPPPPKIGPSYQRCGPCPTRNTPTHSMPPPPPIGPPHPALVLSPSSTRRSWAKSRTCIRHDPSHQRTGQAY